MRFKTKNMIHCSLLTAFLCIVSPLAFPIGPVPITLGFGAVIFCTVSAGIKKSAVSVCLYLLLGALGLPVFSFARSGLPLLFGPTGGYLWSYILVVLVCGCFSCFSHRSIMSYAGAGAGLLVCYLCGTVQYAFLADLHFLKVLGVCVLPFLPFDIIKCALGVWLGLKIRKLVFKRLT